VKLVLRIEEPSPEVMHRVVATLRRVLVTQVLGELGSLPPDGKGPVAFGRVPW
jgi:hypothetical protein